MTTKAASVRLLALDVDGVLTDGRLYFSAEGDTMKAFHSLDGHGLKMLAQNGIETAIITGRTSGIVAARAQELGIKHLLQGREDKLVALRELCTTTGHTLDEVAYAGDDLPDLSAIKACGFGIAVANAVDAVKEHADYCCAKTGGEGAVREICDEILAAQNKLDSIITAYLEAGQ